ncbi:hypothetical protein NQ314_003284 [Rhamnusium bicolor]|uniref:Uncharacterized protein n=1 Tax=Rhamnusium bicolor TaxID=1586634 RepID=A0AAV8ZP58_9CUCU|nr:hypothetical protein NQ314_003284 [Rhamnusium bicolor]
MLSVQVVMPINVTRENVECEAIAESSLSDVKSKQSDVEGKTHQVKSTEGNDPATVSSPCACVLCLQGRKTFKGKEEHLLSCVSADAKHKFKSDTALTGNMELIYRINNKEAARETIFYHKEFYIQTLKENGDFEGKLEAFDLEAKLMKSFPKQISIISMNKSKIVKPKDGQLISNDLESITKGDIISKATLIIRDEIKKIKRSPLPKNLTSSNMIQGECDIPELIDQFYWELISSTGWAKSSYTVLEELETDATFTSIAKSDVCPEDIVRAPMLGTGLAFSNFDGFVDTTSGKDTLHDTVGMVYQNIIDEPEDSNENESNSNSIPDTNVEILDSNECSSTDSPYNKRPKYNETLLSLESPLRKCGVDTNDLKRIDLVWMLSHFLNLPNTPSWVGFNSIIHDDKSCQQRISYLTAINCSPINNAVVYETMKQCQRAANECKEVYMQVTYDLAISKIALQIQSKESPLFNNLFVHIGSFHIMMSYFKAIGKFIDGCGLSNIMVNSELLASGLVKSFLEGKHFNRCKHLHPIISLALQLLHFQVFLDESETKSEKPIITNEKSIKILEEYEKIEEKTLNGEHGKTPQFFMTYSYARYLVLYHEKLIRLDETHPGLNLQLQNGFFGIKRTKKDFSRQAVDLTLEQTINADVANKLTGISYLTNSIAARQRLDQLLLGIWANAQRNVDNFIKKNNNWLQGTFGQPAVAQRFGRPPTALAELSERSKRGKTEELRGKTEELRSTTSEEMLLHAAKITLQTSGKRTASQMLKEMVVSSKQKLKKGEMVAQGSNTGIFVEKWRDKRDVTMLNTKFVPGIIKIRKRSGEIQKPKLVVEYNKYKSYIDISEPDPYSTDEDSDYVPSAEYYKNNSSCDEDDENNSPSGRTRQRNPQNWKRDEVKQKRVKCQQYISNGKTRGNENRYEDPSYLETYEVNYNDQDLEQQE